MALFMQVLYILVSSISRSFKLKSLKSSRFIDCLFVFHKNCTNLVSFMQVLLQLDIAQPNCLNLVCMEYLCDIY